MNSKFLITIISMIFLVLLFLFVFFFARYSHPICPPVCEDYRNIAQRCTTMSTDECDEAIRIFLKELQRISDNSPESNFRLYTKLGKPFDNSNTPFNAVIAKNILKFNHLCCKLIFSDFRKTHDFKQFFKRSKVFFRFIASLSADDYSPSFATVLYWSFVGYYSESLMQLSINSSLSGNEVKEIEMLLTHAGNSLNSIKPDKTYSDFGPNGGRVYIGMAIFVSAIYSYRKDNGNFPVSVSDLIPKYMKSLPLDYFSKKAWDLPNKNILPIKYYYNDGQWYLKSFGKNYKDDNYTPEKALADLNPIFYKKDYILTEKMILSKANSKANPGVN